MSLINEYTTNESGQIFENGNLLTPQQVVNRLWKSQQVDWYAPTLGRPRNFYNDPDEAGQELEGDYDESQHPVFQIFRCIRAVRDEVYAYIWDDESEDWVVHSGPYETIYDAHKAYGKA